MYDGPIRNILLQLKYLKNFSLGDELAHQAAGAINKFHWSIDCIVPIPLGKKRLMERGYNQVGMIAFSLAEIADWEYLPRALERDSRNQFTSRTDCPGKKRKCQGCLPVPERKNRGKNRPAPR